VQGQLALSVLTNTESRSTGLDSPQWNGLIAIQSSLHCTALHAPALPRRSGLLMMAILATASGRMVDWLLLCGYEPKYMRRRLLNPVFMLRDQLAVPLVHFLLDVQLFSCQGPSSLNLRNICFRRSSCKNGRWTKRLIYS
jgi:hypothetical protein